MKHIVYILAVILATSCVSYDRCVEKYGRIPADTIQVPHEVIVPRDSIVTRIIIDSIPFILPGDTVFVRDTESRAQIRYWRDRYNNALNVQADCDSIVIRDTIPVPHPVILEPPPPGKLQRIWDAYRFLAAIALPLLVLLISISFKAFSNLIK